MRGRALAFPCVRLFPPAPCGLSLPGCAGPPVAPGWGAVGRRRLRPPALSSRACAVWSLSGPRLSLPCQMSGGERTRTADLYIPRTEHQRPPDRRNRSSFRAPVARPNRFARAPRRPRMASELGILWWR